MIPFLPITDYALPITHYRTYLTALEKGYIYFPAHLLINLNREPELKQSVQQQRKQVYDSAYTNTMQDWWKAEGQDCTQQLINVTVEYRNIGHAWRWERTAEVIAEKVLRC